MEGSDDRRPATGAPLEFGGRVKSRLVDMLIVAFGLAGMAFVIGALGRGLRQTDDLFLLLLGTGMGVLAGLFWRHLRRPHFILCEDRLTLHALLTSRVIPYADIDAITVRTRYRRQFLYRPVSPYPEYMREDMLVLKMRGGRTAYKRLPYSPSGQPIAHALSDRTGIAWEHVQDTPHPTSSPPA